MYMYMDIYTYGYIDLRGGASPLSLSMNVCVGGVYTNICIHTQVRDLLCAPGDNEGKKFGIVAGEHGGMAVADLVRVPVTTSADIDKLMRYVRHILCIYTYIYIHIHIYLVRVPVTTSADIDKLMRASCVPVLYVWWVGPVCPSCVQYAPATAPPAAHTHGRGGDGDQHMHLHTPVRQAYTHKGTHTHTQAGGAA